MVMSNYFFLVVNTFPKLHADNLFGWALSPSKIDLVWASEPKLFQKNIWQNNFLIRI